MLFIFIPSLVIRSLYLLNLCDKDAHLLLYQQFLNILITICNWFPYNPMDFIFMHLKHDSEKWFIAFTRLPWLKKKC